MNKYLLIILFFLGYAENNLHAAYINRLLVLHPAPTLNNQSITLEKGKKTFNIPLQWPRRMYPGPIPYLDFSCSIIPLPPMVGHKGTQTQWLFIPEMVTASGSNIKFNIMPVNSATNWEQHGLSQGYNLISLKNGYQFEANQRCDYLPHGHEALNVANPALHTFIEFAVNSNTILPPGEYILNFDIYYILEENSGDPSDGKLAQKVKNLRNKAAVVPMTIIVKSAAACTINSKDITLNHGTITPQQAKNGHQSKADKVAIACSAPAKITAKLEGANKVANQTANYTQCGKTGNCELTFSGDKFSDSKYQAAIEVEQNIPTTLEVKSTYHDENPQPGAFEGNGVLKLNIE